jgi:hypothetical protein
MGIGMKNWSWVESVEGVERDKQQQKTLVKKADNIRTKETQYVRT